jgi:uncharacterized membrane protein
MIYVEIIDHILSEIVVCMAVSNNKLNSNYSTLKNRNTIQYVITYHLWLHTRKVFILVIKVHIYVLMYYLVDIHLFNLLTR